MPKQLLILFICPLVLACAGSDITNRLDAYLASGDCPAAMALIDESGDSYGSNQQLLFLLDAAMVHLQCANLAAAQANFRRAEALAEQLWTESITRNALSLVTNDTILPYAGEDYERVMIHLMSAIGFLQADQPDEALVEARRLDTLLAVYNDKYEKKNVYKEDAFARYLSGMLHEADDAWDDAFIDYRRAVEIYRDDYQGYGISPPKMLMVDLVRAASVVDRLQDLVGLVPADRIDGWILPAFPHGQGKLVLIAFAGYAPQKIQDMVVVPGPYGPVGMAFPRMVVTPPFCEPGRLTLYGEDHFFDSNLVVVEDINRIAVKNLDDRKGRILAKTIARAVAKQVAIHGIGRLPDKRNDQETIEAIVNVANILLLERADTRGWRTLPGQIYMTRMYLPAGTYQVTLNGCGEQAMDLGTLSVGPGMTRYLFRDLRYPAPSRIHRQK